MIERISLEEWSSRVAPGQSASATTVFIPAPPIDYGPGYDQPNPPEVGPFGTTLGPWRNARLLAGD